MFPSFLPDKVAQLTEPTSIAMAAAIQQHNIDTSLSSTAIATTYVTQGHSDTPLLLLHGFDSSLLEFRRLWPQLAAAQETWAIDLLGFGFTDRPADISYSPVSQQQHLYHCWQTLIQRPVILVGASMGGGLALEFAVAHPECVERLVLIDSVGLADAPAPLMVPPFDSLAAAFLRNAWVRRRISQQAYCDRTYVTPDAEVCAALHLEHPGWKMALIAFAKSGGYGNLKDTMAQVTQPTLVLWGECDRILGTRDAPQFQQMIPNSTLQWIPDAGHVPHLEHPHLMAEHILAFQHPD